MMKKEDTINKLWNKLQKRKVKSFNLLEEERKLNIKGYKYKVKK